MGHRKQKPNRLRPEDKPLTWAEHMFIGPEDLRVIGAWSSHNGWSQTVAKRNFTIYRALEWLAATLEDQLRETDGWFWCQQHRIARTTGMSRPTIKAAIEHLVEAGWLEHERRWLPMSETVCSWFRLKLPPSCAGRVRKAQAGILNAGLTPPPPGLEKSSRRQCKKIASPSYMSKREIKESLRAQTIGEIEARCIQRGLIDADLPARLVEIAETVVRQERRKLRSAGICDPLDVKLAAERAAATA
jgi:hypothetical protein